jgi:hypothetical protein
MLKYLKSWGYDVEGVELDSPAAQRAKKNLGQKVFYSLEEIHRTSSRKFGAVCFWHSLEHIPEPRKALRLTDDLLIQDGLLIVAAPHMASLQSRLAGRFWLHLDSPRHVAHFNMARLATFFEKSGYRIIRHCHFSQEYNVIDSLCYLYLLLGFEHLYPFHLIKNTPSQPKAQTHLETLKTIVGTSLFLPLTGLACLLANIFSMVGSGSTTTLFLRKQGHGTVSRKRGPKGPTISHNARSTA